MPFSTRSRAPAAPADSGGQQRLAGPYKGYFILAWAFLVNDKFAGRALICCERPGTGGRAAAPLEEVSSVGAYDSEEKAIQAAEYQARYVIDGLTPNWAPFTAPG